MNREGIDRRIASQARPYDSRKNMYGGRVSKNINPSRSSTVKAKIIPLD